MFIYDRSLWIFIYDKSMSLDACRYDSNVRFLEEIIYHSHTLDWYSWIKPPCLKNATLFWQTLIWNQTYVRLVPNQSLHGKYNPISVWFNKISKRFLCVRIHSRITPTAGDTVVCISEKKMMYLYSGFFFYCPYTRYILSMHLYMYINVGLFIWAPKMRNV